MVQSPDILTNSIGLVVFLQSGEFFQCLLHEAESFLKVAYVKCQVSSVKCQMSNVKCQVSSVKCQMSNVKCQMSSVWCQMSTAYVDPWDMLNYFCFHVYAQKSLFIGQNGNVFFAPVSVPSIELVPS